MLLIAFDTETHRFGPGNMAPRVVCLSWASSEGSKKVVKEDAEQLLHTLLDGALNDTVKLVGHNVAYDFACLLATFPSVWDKVFSVYEYGAVHCTQTREQLLDIAAGNFRQRVAADGTRTKKSYSLASLASDYLNIDMDKSEDTWRLRYGELEDVPLVRWPRAAVNYAQLDATATLEVALAQEKRAQALGYTMPTEAAETRAALALQLLSVWGIETEREHVTKLWEEGARRMNELAGGLVESGIYRINKKNVVEFEGHTALPGISKLMVKLRSKIKNDLGQHTPLTINGAIKTDKETIEMCSDPALRFLVEFNSLQKSLSTFVSKLFQPIVHSRYNTLVETSRTSSYDPNMQNQPRLVGVRESFRARCGYVLVGCDYDCQEMRTWAQTCLDTIGHSRLAKRFQENCHFDPHLFLAAQLAHVSFEEATERYKNKDKEIKHFRQHSKPANFGFMGGMGPEAYVSYARGYEINIDIAQASYMKGVWKDTWPEQADYFRLIGEQTRSESGTITLPRSGFRRADIRFTQAANTYFQGSAAQISKRSLWEATKRCYSQKNSTLYGSRPVIFIHDENVLEVRLDRVHEVAVELETLMVEVMEEATPDVPAAASATAMIHWSKDAERVTDNEGRLIPWMPQTL